jgi:hypothetical protein
MYDIIKEGRKERGYTGVNSILREVVSGLDLWLTTSRLVNTNMISMIDIHLEEIAES